MLYFISQASRNCVRHKNPRIDRLFLFLIYNHSTISKHNDTHCISYQWEVKEQTHTFMQSRIIPLPLVWPLSEGMVDQSPIRFCLLTDEFLAWGTPHLHTNNLWYRKVPLLHTHTGSLSRWACVTVEELGWCEHQASLAKLQCCRAEVKNLGHVLQEGQWLLSPVRLQLLLLLFCCCCCCQEFNSDPGPAFTAKITPRSLAALKLYVPHHPQSSE